MPTRCLATGHCVEKSAGRQNCYRLSCRATMDEIESETKTDKSQKSKGNLMGTKEPLKKNKQKIESELTSARKAITLLTQSVQVLRDIEWRIDSKQELPEYFVFVGVSQDLRNLVTTKYRVIRCQVCQRQKIQPRIDLDRQTLGRKGKTNERFCSVACRTAFRRKANPHTDNI